MYRWTAGADTDSALPSTAKDDGNGQLTVKVTYHDVSRRYCCDVSNQHGQILSKCIMINVLGKVLCIIRLLSSNIHTCVNSCSSDCNG